MSAEPQRPAFATEPEGYDRHDVDRYLAALGNAERALRRRVEELEQQNADLHRRLERLRGERDALRAAAGQLEELETTLERLRDGYDERVHALESVIVSVLKEATERTEGVTTANGGGPAGDAAERSADAEAEPHDPGGPDEPYRGDWGPPQT